MKKLLTLFLLTLFITGCSSPSFKNTVKLNTVQEKFEFNVVDESIALEKSEDFLEAILDKESDASFIIHYKPQFANVLEEITILAKNKGVMKKKVSTVAISGDDEKDISILATYTAVDEKDCGDVNFFNKDEYKFGCALEYNRNLSLVNPLSQVE